ncbi:branched-chain amino acid ABC transporter permease [Amycolatopsis sp. NPDC005232]|uniref:branched-chain amino acid ABC transporter permease n=1 Tax=Amycolatopsis sp. NPDC005232 TaxID=3157027 RepID=UPI0033B7029F
MQTFVTAMVTSLLLGGTYSLIALGLVLVFRATHVFNFAYGQMMLLAAYVIGRWATGTTWSFLGTVLIAFVITAVVSALFYQLVLRKMLGASVFLTVVATLAFASFLDGLMGIVFNAPQYSVRNPLLPTGSFDVAGAKIQSSALLIAVANIALASAVAAFLQRTRTGIRIRAAGQMPLLASQGGINVRRMFVVTWAVAGVLAALAGLSFASTNLVTAQIADVALFALPAMMLGGLDSVPGAILGGVLIGLLQGVTTMYWGGQHVNLVTYVALLLILLLLPQGLFGTRIVKRV